MLTLGILVAVAGGVVWTGGTLAAAITGSGDPVAPFGFDAGVALVTDGPAALWPTTHPTAIWTATAVLAVLLCIAAGLVAARTAAQRAARARPEAAMADRRDLAHLAPKGATAKARRLRPSLADRRRIAPADTGLLLGELVPSGPQLRASWEDVAMAVMAPRAGKTTALAVPAVLDAPGPVVATSNKADLWATTAKLRGDVGPVFTFDPQGITGRPPAFWWNPLHGVDNVEAAHRLAGHFIGDLQAETKRDFWISAAHDLLTGMLLAAGTSDRTVVDVYRWLTNPLSTEPIDLLADTGQLAAARGLESRQNGAPETRDGIYETARTAAQALRDPHILTWVTPPDARPQLDLERLVGSRSTLYLLSKDGAGAARPLIAALVDATFRAGVTAAERSPGGRLDPPLVAVLDEAANICRIGDLPDLYSHLGSRGITPLTILQSYRQGTRVWGQAGMDTLWSAATIKLIGAGIDDPRLLDDLAKLIGHRDITTRTTSHSRRGTNDSWSTRKDPIMAADTIRAMPTGQALLLATGAPVAPIRLRPWYETHRADKITSAVIGKNQAQPR
ncbi:TraM recognition domain-containing protein [Nitriliruptoria bacterium AS10]|nr:TraM recognition domain-containing protein [Salsipaludibacter albus]